MVIELIKEGRGNNVILMIDRVTSMMISDVSRKQKSFVVESLRTTLPNISMI